MVPVTVDWGPAPASETANGVPSSRQKLTVKPAGAVSVFTRMIVVFQPPLSAT